MKERMRALLHTEFNALLARAGVTQAGFARLAGLTPRQVNNWARGRAAVPKWAGTKEPPGTHRQTEREQLACRKTLQACNPSQAASRLSRPAGWARQLRYHRLVGFFSANCCLRVTSSFRLLVWCRSRSLSSRSR